LKPLVRHMAVFWNPTGFTHTKGKTSTADPDQILILRGGPGQRPWVLLVAVTG